MSQFFFLRMLAVILKVEVMKTIHQAGVMVMRQKNLIW